MQHPDQRFGAGAEPAPARQPRGLREAAGEEGVAGLRPRRGRDPGEQGDEGERERQFVEPSEFRRQAAAAFGQPVPREGGHDAPADQRDRHDRRGKPNAQAVARRREIAPRGFPVEQRVAGDEPADRGDDDKVAPVSADRDLAQHDPAEDDETGEVGRRHRRGRQGIRRRDRDPAESPEREQPEQGPSGERLPAGPARHGGQQEPRQDRAEIAEQRLMGMPRHRVERRRQRDPPRQHRYPERHGDRRPQRGGKEKGPEAVGQATGRGGGRRHIASPSTIIRRRSRPTGSTARGDRSANAAPAARTGMRPATQAVKRSNHF